MEAHLPDPIPLGPFDVEHDGILTLREPPSKAQLRFSWRGRSCEAWLSSEGVSFGMIAGRVPSTAGPGSQRASTFALLRDMPAGLPPGWRVGLTPDHRIRVEAQDEVAMPASTVRLIAVLVRFALALDPVLDRLEAAGAEYVVPPLLH